MAEGAVSGSARRLAISAHDEAAADKLWGDISKRVRKQEKFGLERAPLGAADIAVYMLDENDLADPRAKADAIAKDSAPVKFLVAPEGADGDKVAELGRQTHAETLGAGAHKIIARVVKGVAAEEAVQAAAAKPVRRPAPAASEKPVRLRGAARAAKKEAKRKEKAEREAEAPEAPDAAAEVSGKPKRLRGSARAAKKEAKRKEKAEHEAEAPAPIAEAPEKPERLHESAGPAKKRTKRKQTPDAVAEAAAPLPQASGEKTGRKRKTQSEVPPADVKAARKKRARRAKAARKDEAPQVAPEAASETSPPEKKAKRRSKKADDAPKKKTREAKAEKPELTAEEKAARKAERKSKKAEAAPGKKKRKAKADTPELTPEEKAARKAERKAKKSELTAEEKAARKTERKNKKEDLSPEEKAARKAARKAAKEEEETGPLHVAMSGLSPSLRAAVEDAFRAAGVELDMSGESRKLDLTVYGFDAPPPGHQEVVQMKARQRIFLQGADADANRAMVALAEGLGGSVVQSEARYRRFNTRNDALVAHSILDIAQASFSRRVFAPVPCEIPSDLAEARAIEPAALLGQMRWSNPAPPRAIWTHASQEDAEALADSKVIVSEEKSLALPLDWAMELDDRHVQNIVLGLDFLAGPLLYWYSKAGGQSSETISAIDAALKARNVSPNALFARATQIILDFLEKNPRDKAPAAWEEKTLTRRARVLALYMLCCRTAFKRKIKFSEPACAAVWHGLLDALEVLRGDDFYEPCSTAGVDQDCLATGLGLCLRGTAYGNRLIVESLERLKTLQLEPGLTADSVWHGGSYSEHCAVLASVTGLIGDFPPADAAQTEALAAAAKKMTVFAEALLRSDGHPAAIDDSRQKSYAEKLSGMRRAIARTTGGKGPSSKGPLRNRITDTYIFRDAQYLISHSAQKVAPDASLAVLHAAAPRVADEDPGGIVLVFSQGASNLLVHAEPPEGTSRKDKQAKFDPSLRNFYRVGGAGNPAPSEEDPRPARIVKSWRGTGWAAAKAVEDNYASAAIRRTMVHLKTVHALIVVDELSSAGEAEFEQFWHIAEEFSGTAERFCAPEKGGMSVAFSGPEPVEVEAGPCLHRRLRLAEGVTAAIFQWTDEAAPLSIRLERGGLEDWALSASGRGFEAKVALTGSELRCETSS